MSTLGPEFRGKLPPGAATQHQRSLDGFAASARVGALRGVKVLPGPGCKVSMAQAKKVYALASVPELPFDGCDRSPCCACCYSPVSK